jgi:hypothetical protein
MESGVSDFSSETVDGEGQGGGSGGRGQPAEDLADVGLSGNVFATAPTPRERDKANTR